MIDFQSFKVSDTYRCIIENTNWREKTESQSNIGLQYLDLFLCEKDWEKFINKYFVTEMNSLFMWRHLNPLTPESDQHLISPYSIIIKSHFLGHENKENDLQLKKFLTF